MNTDLVQLKGVEKKFRKNVVLDGVNLSIPENQITGIIGASGEGKSTILKIMIGFYKPSKGDVLYLKRSVFNDINHVNKTFGFATEDGSFYQELSVLENLYHFGYLYGMKRKEVRQRAEELLDFVGLTYAEKTRARYLSVGMKKRLDLACSIMHTPEVLIMDEPTADLDPLLRKQILDLIRTIRDRGTTIVLTTQILEEMDGLCDKIAVLCNRKIVEEGKPSKLKSKYRASGLNEVFEKIFKKYGREEKRFDLKKGKRTKRKVVVKKKEISKVVKAETANKPDIKKNEDGAGEPGRKEIYVGREAEKKENSRQEVRNE